MRNILYTTNCPKCKILEKKLDAAGIKYQRNTDVDEMRKLGFMEAPVFFNTELFLGFVDAAKWVNEQGV